MSESANPDVVEIAELAETGTKWGTIVGRVILALLLVVLAIEAHAKFGHDRTLTSLRENASKVMGDVIHGEQGLEEWSLPLAEAEKCISGFPSKTRKKTVFQSPVVMLRWFSLFKTYVVQLHLDDDNIVVLLTTEDVE